MKKQEKVNMINVCALSLIEFIDDQKLIDEDFRQRSINLVEKWRRHYNKIIEKNI